MIGRMKFEIDALVDEILDRLPEEVWTSPTTTFLDPAIGGGQFVRSIEARLRKAGHSDDSISQRVFGFEKGDLNIRYAVNRYGLVGQYSRVSYDELFEKGIDMKFDVVVGNPPYNADSINKPKLWQSFVKIAFDVEANFIAFVTPNKWLISNNPGSKDASRSIRNLLINNGSIFCDTNANLFFRNIGDDIGWWIWSRGTKEKNIIKNKQGQTIEIDNLENFDYRVLNNDDVIYTSIKKKILFQEGPTWKLLTNTHFRTKDLKNSGKYEFYYSGKNWKAGLKFVDEKPNDYDKIKVILNRTTIHSTKEPNLYNFVAQNVGVGIWASYINFDNITEANNFITFLRSKAMQCVLEHRPKWDYDPFRDEVARCQSRKNAKNLKNIAHIPLFDVKNPWTDEMVYQFFQLSQEEIDYIERTVV